MGWTNTVWGTAMAVLGLFAACASSAMAGPAAPGKAPDIQRLSPDARYVARWALDSHDNGTMPFVVVDKKDARIYVFEADGGMVGSASVLLGSAIGDQSLPGVGERTQTRTLGPADRTTPAGRFTTTPGRNLEGEQIVWVDYEAAFAIHRVRPGVYYEQRLARLASPSPQDNRVSLGCVVVPVDFYLGVVQPLLGRQRAVVYVLPETQPVRDVFGPLAL